MPNYSAKILNSSISGLSAQQAVIAATANNIANVSTPGYSRRIVNLETRNVNSGSSELNVGDGVNVAGITRMVNAYLERTLKETLSSEAGYEIQSEALNRIQTLFSLDGETQTIGGAMTQFFTAVNDLAVDPSSIELRANVIQRAEDLVSIIQTTYNTIAKVQTECDQRVGIEVDEVNSITAQIASLNATITAREGGSGQVAADERDNREALLNKLAEKIGFNSIELPDGSVTVTLSNGFALVSGSVSRNLSFTHDPSFSSGTLPQSLDGGVLGYVVYDYDPGAGNAHVDLTEGIMNNGGVLGGLLTVRGYADPSNTSPFQATGPLVEIAQRVEAVTRTLLTSVNKSYLGPSDEDTTTPAFFNPSSGDLDGNSPDIYGLFDIDYTGVKDVNGNGLPDDLGLMTAQNYSSILKLNFTDPRRLAAAIDTNAASGSKSFAPGDGRNMQNLADLQNQDLTFAAGSFSLTGTFGEAYNEAVVKVGGLTASAQGNYDNADKYLQTVRGQRDEVSAVSLDEEFSNLIKYQRAYQASARLIRIADQLLEQLVSLI